MSCYDTMSEIRSFCHEIATIGRRLRRLLSVWHELPWVVVVAARRFRLAGAAASDSDLNPYPTVRQYR